MQATEVLLAETGVPRDALVVDDHIMRRDGLARQVVLGVDDARRAAGGSREGLQLVAPLRRFRLVDRAEVLGGGAVHLHALVAALFHLALGFAQLRGLRITLVP